MINFRKKIKESNIHTSVNEDENWKGQKTGKFYVSVDIEMYSKRFKTKSKAEKFSKEIRRRLNEI